MAGRRSRHVAMSLVVLLLVNACTTARQAAPPDLAERLERVRTIVLVPPKAEVFREFVGTETAVPEWSTDAERNLTVALTRHLEFWGRFAVRVLRRLARRRRAAELKKARRGGTDNRSSPPRV